MYSSSRHEPCGLARRSNVPLAVNRSHSKLTLIASNTAHAIDRPQLPQARLLRRRQGILKENASTSLDLQSCQTACKLQVTFALLPQFCQLVRFGCVVERERDRHMGLKMSKCGFSSLNLFSALTWSARCPRSHPKRRSIATPALNPNAPARCRLAGEYASASATASAPSASASRLSSGMLSSTIDPGSGCAPPRPASSAS